MEQVAGTVIILLLIVAALLVMGYGDRFRWLRIDWVRMTIGLIMTVAMAWACYYFP